MIVFGKSNQSGNLFGALRDEKTMNGYLISEALKKGIVS